MRLGESLPTGRQACPARAGLASPLNKNIFGCAPEGSGSAGSAIRFDGLRQGPTVIGNAWVSMKLSRLVIIMNKSYKTIWILSQAHIRYYNSDYVWLG